MRAAPLCLYLYVDYPDVDREHASSWRRDRLRRGVASLQIARMYESVRKEELCLQVPASRIRVLAAAWSGSRTPTSRTRAGFTKT